MLGKRLQSHTCIEPAAKLLCKINCAALPDKLIESELLAMRVELTGADSKGERVKLNWHMKAPFFLMRLVKYRMTFK